MQTKQVKVFVVDVKGVVCLPTTSARARRLLKEGKAKVLQVVPFTIQLNYEIKNPVGKFTLSVDDGAKEVGLAIVNRKLNEVVFRGKLELRQDVKKLVEQRRNYRRVRRSRKLRFRQPRFDNRIAKKLAPSIRCRKDSIMRFLKDMMKRVAINEVIVEEVKFNHVKYKYGKFFSLVEQGKNYLKESVLNLGLLYKTCFGYETKEKRLKLGLSKKHSNDAIAMSCDTTPLINSLEWFIKPRRSKIWENHPTRTCMEKNGFKHWDLVKTLHRTKGFIIGSIRSLKKREIALRTKFDDNFPVGYSRTKLLYRPNGLVYAY